MSKVEQNLNQFLNKVALEDYFTLIDTCTSHSQIMYRCIEFKGEGNNSNIDLLFVGVEFMIMPTSLQGLKGISLVNSSGNKELDILIKPYMSGRKLIKLDYDKGTAFVVLERIMYSENKLPPENTSIPSKLEEPMNKESILQMVQDMDRIGYTEYKKRFNDDWKIII